MEDCVKRKHVWLPMQFVLAMTIISLIASACSLPGAQNTTSGVTPTVSVHPSPVANQPTGVGTPPSGTQLPENEVKPLTFNLIYNDTAMEQDVAQMYTPDSSTFHQFLTPDQIVQKYALSADQQKQVMDWLTQHGYNVEATDSLHTSIKVHATVATIERTLNIKLKSFTIAGHEFFMQEGNPTLPQSVASLVSSVVGLDNFAFPEFKPPFGFVTHGAAATGNCSNYGTKQTLTRNKLAAAYQVDKLYSQGFQGQGMTIGVAEFGDAYDPKDLANYAPCVGIATPNVQNIDVDGHLASGSGQGEAIMDLELIAGLAPKAQILDYQTDGQTSSFAQEMVDVFNRVASDHKVQVLSVSYGTFGGVSENTDFKRLAWQVGTGTTTSYDGALTHVFIRPLDFVNTVEAPNGLRQVPDVAAAAYPNIAIYYKGAWVASGGTSAAAPIWAAGALLVDQALQQKGKPALGGGPEFYSLANHPGNFRPYNDITIGDNLFYSATKGWDYTTGWGSPNFNDILQLELNQ